MGLSLSKVREDAAQPSNLAAVVEAIDAWPSYLARELHDLVAQPLVGLVSGLADLRSQAMLDAQSGELMARLEDSARRVLGSASELLVDLCGQGEIRLNFRAVPADELVRRSVEKAMALAAAGCRTDGFAVATTAQLGARSRLLSNRETFVLKQVASGMSNKQIARLLGISEKTVRNHLARVFGKLHAGNRTEAVMKAMRLGIDGF